jgi:hypothetical protein
METALSATFFCMSNKSSNLNEWILGHIFQLTRLIVSINLPRKIPRGITQNQKTSRKPKRLGKSEAFDI